MKSDPNTTVPWNHSDHETIRHFSECHMFVSRLRVSCAVMCYSITKANSSTCCTGSCCYRQLETVLVSEDGWRMFSENMRRSAANPRTGRASEHRRGFEPEVSVWIHQTCSSDPVQFLSFSYLSLSSRVPSSPWQLPFTETFLMRLQ